MSQRWSSAELPWLPEPPKGAEYRAATRACSDGAALQALARHRLDGNQLHALAKQLARLRESGAELQPLIPVRLALLANGAVDLIAPALIGTALRYGIALEVWKPGHEQVVQAVLQPDSELYTKVPDVVLLALDYRGLLESGGFEHWSMLRGALASKLVAPVIVQTVAPPPEAYLGNYSRRVETSSRALAAEFNRQLLDAAEEHGDLLLDVSALAGSVGLEAWDDPMQRHLYKLPFCQRFVPLYCEHVARLLGLLQGRAGKCLVLDLDNTLWGGVIGDDGLAGIRLGQGDAVGEAHRAIQQMALDLRDRGVLLAVCSKNDDARARQPFLEHPEMLLKEEHISIFQANWTDKASNLEAIASALDIGLDSLVFLDDNPAERAQVRDALPQVQVPELPEDPALFPRALLASGAFEVLGFTKEDANRARSYRAKAKRAELRAGSRDLGEYLESLEMRATFNEFDGLGRARITQLIGRSNQFNLTTRRHSETEIRAMEDDPEVHTLQVRLTDRFGDNGMVSVVICRPVAEAGCSAWVIDTWLMSCRVLGRRLEEAVRDELVRAAQAAGVDELWGQYLPTERNQIVREHYPKLGFQKMAPRGEATVEGECWWRLRVGGYLRAELPIEVVRRSS
ncbi:MAG TPA: haloacid dehalogenase [Deltaproteobacteria bacterium]|nr:haloacid dehalogenase [Deltaproteobacteria bacterium]HCP46959.1 haloacid dehalogenase [Deltaproteobacteria bacterium]